MLGLTALQLLGIVNDHASMMGMAQSDTVSQAQLAEAVRAYQAAQAGVDDAKRKAEEKIRASRDRVTATRTELAQAIVGAAVAGMRQVDIIRATGYSRETVRSILRAGGVEPD